ncbi:hypothetical protein DPEC_G00276070 [Dallia pectoralis]|uniref:Uncharacterized protein n=1 Tax=Dallia pectoralis TaxID=75939 RepID=A0ACC2FLL8_DALPE|nr:hypothetical protein DPEC_G00276070 [Dallia pectoralis]
MPELMNTIRQAEVPLPPVQSWRTVDFKLRLLSAIENVSRENREGGACTQKPPGTTSAMFLTSLGPVQSNHRRAEPRYRLLAGGPWLEAPGWRLLHSGLSQR